ncbi:hypothetical protein ACFW5S_31165 [Streptomyces olivaceus]|uniref:hypothetical protein n=1 Tax=Streptomyces olivaceus TaxID=47716 RepID=UPI0033B27930
MFPLEQIPVPDIDPDHARSRTGWTSWTSPIMIVEPPELETAADTIRFVRGDGVRLFGGPSGR